MRLHLQVIGSIMILLAFIHIAFPKYFRWRDEFRNVSLLNRQMMYIHTLFLAVVLLLSGLLCVGYPDELLHTALGRIICFGFGIFWLLRLLVQFWGYSSKLWRGKKFETSIHILFSLLWGYFTFVFGMVIFNSESIH